MLSYKRDHGNWQEVQLDADRMSYVLQSLHCGATYHTYLTAHNKVGNSRTSGIVTAITKGGGNSELYTTLATIRHSDILKSISDHIFSKVKQVKKYTA